MTWIQTAVVNAILHALDKIIGDIGDGVLQLLSGLLYTPMGLLDDLALLEMIKFARTLAWLLLPVLAIRQAITIAASRAEGNASESFESFFRRAALCAAAVAGTTTLVTVAMQFADSLIQSFLNAGTGITMLDVLFEGQLTNFWAVFLAAGLLVAFIVLLINRAILVAQLAAQMWLGPLLALSIVWGNDSAPWNTWVRETVSIILTFVWQTACLWWLLSRLGGWSSDTFDGKLLIIGIIVLMVKGSETIRKYVYSAGGGSAVLAGGAAAGRLAITVAMMKAAPGAIFKK